MTQHHWDRIIRGDAASFKYVFESHYKDLFAFGWGIHADRAMIKDSIQDLFLELWKKRNELPEVQNHSAYLKQILKRKLYKKLKDIKKSSFANQDNPTHTYSYETELINQQNSLEDKEKLKRILQQLSPTQREVIQLRFYKGLSYEEIAELNNTKKRTIYNQVHSALKVLKKAMHVCLLF